MTQQTAAETRAIATRATELTFTVKEEMSLTDLAGVFYRSGMFSDIKDITGAMVKVLAGREMGLEPVQSMMSLYIVHDRIGIYAEALASKIKDDPNSRYKILEHTDEVCSIMFYERIDGAWEECGPPSTFTAADAKKAGTQNMGKFPRNMLFSRALSNGFRWYTPHLKLARLYTPEELEEVVANEIGVDGQSQKTAQLEEALEFEVGADEGDKVEKKAEAQEEAPTAAEDHPTPASDESSQTATQSGTTQPPESAGQESGGVSRPELAEMKKPDLLTGIQQMEADHLKLDHAEKLALRAKFKIEGKIDKAGVEVLRTYAASLLDRIDGAQGEMEV